LLLVLALDVFIVLLVAFVAFSLFFWLPLWLSIVGTSLSSPSMDVTINWAYGEQFDDMFASRTIRLEALGQNERVVAVMKKLKEDPGAILTEAEDAALNSLKIAEEQLAAIKSLAAQRAVKAQPKRQRDELEFFKCDFGLADGKINKSLAGQRDTLVELWNKMQDVKDAVADLTEVLAGERPTKMKQVEAAITEGEKSFARAAKNLVVVQGWPPCGG
ncbi:hypothetical protein Vafri_13337, partial [Volvox africanus]